MDRVKMARTVRQLTSRYLYSYICNIEMFKKPVITCLKIYSISKMTRYHDFPYLHEV